MPPSTVPALLLDIAEECARQDFQAAQGRVLLVSSLVCYTYHGGSADLAFQPPLRCRAVSRDVDAGWYADFYDPRWTVKVLEPARVTLALGHEHWSSPAVYAQGYALDGSGERVATADFTIEGDAP